MFAPGVFGPCRISDLLPDLERVDFRADRFSCQRLVQERLIAVREPPRRIDEANLGRAAVVRDLDAGEAFALCSLGRDRMIGGRATDASPDKKMQRCPTYWLIFEGLSCI